MRSMLRLIIYTLIYLIISVSVSYGKSAHCTENDDCTQKFGMNSYCNDAYLEMRCKCQHYYRLYSTNGNCKFKETSSVGGEPCLSSEECLSGECNYDDIRHDVGTCRRTSRDTDFRSRTVSISASSPTNYWKQNWLIGRIVGIVVTLLIVAAIIVFLIRRRRRMRREQMIMYQRFDQAQYPQQQQFPQQPYPQFPQQHPQSQPQPYPEPQPAENQPPAYHNVI
ncbi:Uncharacterised protein at_DN0220 [Pycnogonum litorale]